MPFLWFFPRSASISADPECASPDADSPPPEVINIKGDQFILKTDDLCKINLSSSDMIALGLTTAIGGHYFAWNNGLTIGFGGFAVVLLLVSTAFYCLVLCVAELSSALPFAGGAYGIARVTLGIYPGFLVAVCDSFKSIIYASSAAYSVGEMMWRAVDGPILIEENRVYQFAYWLGFYMFCLSIHLYGRKFFWRVNMALAALSVIILFIYIFGSIRFVDFEENASYPGETGIGRWFHGSMYEFMSVLPLGTRFFQGIQSINLACGHIKNPKTEVPKGYVWSMTFVMFTSFAVLVLATGTKPGLLIFINRLRPLSNGFKQILAIPHHRAAVMSLPPTVMSGFGFMYHYGQQLFAMGKSGLLNPWFGEELPCRHSPYFALIVGSVLGYGLCVVKWYYPDMLDQLYALSILGATTTFLSIFASFVAFRWYFPTIQREFVSPLGMAGAVYGCLVFALCFISVCGFQKDQMALIMYVSILVVASVYYYFVVQKRQVFSEEEQTVMFKAYLVKGNAAKANRIRRGTKASDKKYIPMQVHAQTSSPTCSTKPTPSPHQQRQLEQTQQEPQEQQEQQEQHRTPARWGNGSRKKSEKIENKNENKNESKNEINSQSQFGDKNNSKKQNQDLVNTGEASPQNDPDCGSLRLYSPSVSVYHEESEISKHSHMESLGGDTLAELPIYTQFCDLV